MNKTDALPTNSENTREPSEYVGASLLAAMYGKHKGTIIYNIRNGRLPAISIIGKNRITTHGIRLEDAALLWGDPKYFHSDNAA